MDVCRSGGPTGRNICREWTLVPTMDVSIGPCDGIGDEFSVVVALLSNAIMTMGPMLVIILGPPGCVGCGPG